MQVSLTVALLIALLTSHAALAETVYVKYRGPLDLSPFKCELVTRSSLVQRLCYDQRNKYAVVNLNGTYYHYCGMPSDVIDAWRTSDSMGRFYNAYVKGRFDCRINPVPSY